MNHRFPLLVTCVALAASAGAAPGAPGAAGSGAATKQSKRDETGSVVRVEHRDPTALPARGPTNAIVTVEIFFTPGPTWRRETFRYLEKLQANHPSRVRLVYRIVKGSMARFPYAALHAYSEGKFFEFLELLHGAPRALDDKALLELGRKVGLDSERLLAAITRPPAAYDKLLEANQRRLRKRTRSSGTQMPAVLFNGKAPTALVSSMRTDELEREYNAARDAAEELLDRGVSREELASAFDQIVTLPEDIEIHIGATDEELEDVSAAPRLATPPLAYSGLPSHGSATAAITIAVLCSPTSLNCSAPLATAQRVADIYPEQVRVVWGPYFDVGREEAADLSMLADAALCAERDGGRAVDREDNWDPQDSPGWRWVKQVLIEAASRSRSKNTDDMIDRIVAKLRIEPRAFATCRAQVAGTSIAWIEAARRAGVRTTPATIVNGRVYGPINNAETLQQLVDAELAPGLLSPAWSQPEIVPRP
jgi:protein-disulfide isomerase